MKEDLDVDRHALKCQIVSSASIIDRTQRISSKLVDCRYTHVTNCFILRYKAEEKNQNEQREVEITDFFLLFDKNDIKKS
jgi:flagellar biosynthesis/type III secretory pathway chaperone